MAADRRIRDTGIALGFYAVLLAFTRLQFPLGLPGTLFVVGFEAFQEPIAPGLASPIAEAVFGLYVIGLAVVAGRLADRLRRRYGPAGRLRYGLAGALVTMALLAVVTLLVMVVGVVRGGWSPLIVSVIVGLLGLWAGMRVAARRTPTR